MEMDNKVKYCATCGTESPKRKGFWCRIAEKRSRGKLLKSMKKVKNFSSMEIPVEKKEYDPVQGMKTELVGYLETKIKDANLEYHESTEKHPGGTTVINLTIEEDGVYHMDDFTVFKKNWKIRGFKNW